MCHRCGEPLRPGIAFCENCGAPTATAGPQGIGPTPPSPVADLSGASSAWHAGAPVGPPNGPYYGQPYAPATELRPPPEVVHAPHQSATAPRYVMPAAYADVPSDPLVGQASPNEAYLGNRLVFNDNTTPLDPVTNPVYLRSLAVRFVAVVVAWWLGQMLLWLIFLITGAQTTNASTVDQFGDPTGGGGTSSVFTFFLIVSTLYSLLLAILFWFVKLPVQLSEWMLTVDGKGSRARSAIEHMYAIIAARRTPVRRLGVVQVVNLTRGPRDYVQMSDGIYTGLVSCFPHGSDLFIGWTFWLALSPARWVLTSLGRLFGRGAGIYGGTLWDQPKAMREVLHSAVREGVDVATGSTEPVAQGTFGTSVPIVAAG
jgi:hypothetical protein